MRLRGLFGKFGSFDPGDVKIVLIGEFGQGGLTVGDTIFLNKEYWEILAPLARIQLLAHEITHSAQYRELGLAGFLSRYGPEYSLGRISYTPPAILMSTPLGDLDVVDPFFTLDQIAERVADEIETWP